MSNFNPRSHEGSDSCCLYSVQKHLGFQSTLPRGERHVRVIKYSILVPNFNPRSHEGSDQVKNNNINIKEDFNPRSHEGSDFSWGSIAVMYTRISIHAPTRGATSPGEDSPLLNTISIHAPTRGATSSILIQILSISNFNPRSHEGSDQLRGGY